MMFSKVNKHIQPPLPLLRCIIIIPQEACELKMQGQIRAVTPE